MAPLRQSDSDPRPYATAEGFYQGDAVEIAPEGLRGRIIEVEGSHSHRVVVQTDDGMVCGLEDFDLTRIR